MILTDKQIGLLRRRIELSLDRHCVAKVKGLDTEPALAATLAALEAKLDAALQQRQTLHHYGVTSLITKE